MKRYTGLESVFIGVHSRLISALIFVHLMLLCGQPFLKNNPVLNHPVKKYAHPLRSRHGATKPLIQSKKLLTSQR